MDDTTPPLGTPGNPYKLTDPEMMRALAHPARFDIMEYLVLHGPATATECAEVAGLSPSACSYHLRQLARYGIVEEAANEAADGRQRPWRVRIVSFDIPDEDTNPAAKLAGTMLAETGHQHAEQTRARFLNRESEYPPAWREAAGELHDVAFVTPDELIEMRGRINDIVGEYRRLNPAERPDGTLPIRIWLNVYPFFGPEGVEFSGPEEPEDSGPEDAE